MSLAAVSLEKERIVLSIDLNAQKIEWELFAQAHGIDANALLNHRQCHRKVCTEQQVENETKRSEVINVLSRAHIAQTAKTGNKVILAKVRGLFGGYRFSLRVTL